MPTFEDIYADKVEDVVPNVACCFEGELSLLRLRKWSSNSREKEGNRTVPYIAGIYARKTLAKRAQIIKY